MPIDPPTTGRKDTRGLPEGYDPHKLYEYRFERLKKDAQGLEWYLYKYIPYDLIKSFAVAIDPTSRFKVAPGVITPVNRLKYRATASVLDSRSVTNTRVRRIWASGVNYHLIGGCTSPFLEYGGFTDSYNQGLTTQVALPDTLKDTTSRTRLMGSTQGELEAFKSFRNSPPRGCYYSEAVQSRWTGLTFPNDPCLAAGGTVNYQDGGTDVHSSKTNGAGASLSKTTFDAFVAHEKAYNVGLCQAHAFAMIKEFSPFNRSYSLFRNLAELRDLPSSVLSLKDSLQNLRSLYVSLHTSPSLRKIIFDLKKTAKDIPNEYLSYHFGWKQTYKDVMDLLDAPNKISKKINLLIARSGQPTTFRTKRKFVSGESGISGWDYELLPNETFRDSSDGVSSRIERESELRLVINTTFDFPPISSPKFRFNLWLDRLGIAPRVTDVYNLIPWTWLVDYFTGVGNYIECIDNLYHDPSLINWGLLTCESKGKLISDFKSQSYRVSSSYYQGMQTSNSTEWSGNRHTSILEYECRTRKDVAEIMELNATSEPTSLSAYQKSIIGALLAQRADFRRSRSVGRG
jgi:hypothetical protein